MLRVTLALAAALIAYYPGASPAVDGAAPVGVLAVSDHTCVLTNGGGVKCWGDNSAGGLGDGTLSSSSTPVDVVGLASGVTALAAGDRSACALTASGGVRCWGYNEFGQLGDGSTTNRSAPVDVVGLTSGVSQVVARGEHACALVSGGVRCWGANGNGQLGDGSTTNSSIPVEVNGLTSPVVALAAGGEHTCALNSGGGVQCWGWNGNGELGNGTAVDSPLPVDVIGLSTGVSAVATGGRHTCALLAAGGVKCWGYDEYGQLGDGTTTDSLRPVDVAGLSGSVSALTLGGNLSCALMTDGGVACWGLDLTGASGSDAPSDLGPIEVPGLGAGVATVVAGFYHVCALKDDGGVACWGGNDTGQLGNGTTVDSTIPVEVTNADGSPLAAVAGGDPAISGLLPLAIVLVVGLVLVGLGTYVVRRRRRRRTMA